MSGKIFVMLGLFIALIGVSMGVNYVFRVDDEKAALKSIKDTLEGHASAVDQRKKITTALKEELVTVKDLYDRFTSGTESKNNLTKSIAALDSEYTALEKRFKDVVLQSRSTAVGSKIPEVRLLTGAVLKDVMLKTFTDTDVTLNHALGVMKVAGVDLPDDLRERFRYGMSPMVPRPKHEPAEEVGTSAKPAVPAAYAPASLPSQLTTFAAGNSMAAKTQIEIEALDTKIETLIAHKAEWIRKGQDFREMANSAQITGKPSFTYNAQAAQAEDNVRVVAGQIAKVQDEQTRLRKKMVEQMSIAP